MAADTVSWGGEIAATARVSTSGCIDQPDRCQWTHFNDTAVVSPWVSAKPNDQVSARAEIALRFHGEGRGHGLESDTEQMPWSIRIRDAWVSARTEHTELKLGVQRIAWGVAQGISVVDTINPLNLEDPTRLDRRLSTLSGVFTAHTETLSISGVFVPFFVPAALPEADVDLMAGADDLFDERFTGRKNLELGELESRPDVPQDSLKGTAVAVRLRWTPPAGDFALSWHAGRDSLPQVAGDLSLLGYQTKSDRVDVGVPLAYPRVHTYGFTARTELPQDVTAWVETAAQVTQQTSVRPRKNQLEALETVGVIDSVPSPIPETEMQDGEPIIRWIVGADRPFGPVRVVAQWLHGFFTERRQADLNDYGLLGLRWTITPTLRLDTNTASDFKGHMVDAGITFLHGDAAEITVAATHIGGPSDSALGGLKSASNLRTTLSMRF